MNDTNANRDLLTVAWWNAGISYVRGRHRVPTREHDARLAVAPKIVDVLMRRYGVDLLFLGEVGPDFGDLVRPYSWTWGGDGACRLGDMGCVVRDKERTAMLDGPTPINVPPRHDPASLDGRIVQYVFATAGNTFSVFSVHLHSEMRDQHRQRQSAARELRERVLDEQSRVPHVLVLGDMNEEPYGPAVSEVLRTSRSRRLCAGGSLLFNPCWRLMHDHDNQLGGTAHGSGQLSAWEVYDQVAMSSAFVETGSKLFYAGRCEIVEPAGYMRQTSGKAVRVFGHFDHLPIVVEFEVNHG